ncbi:MAG: AAA family ATPase [Synechococcus sp.]
MPIVPDILSAYAPQFLAQQLRRQSGLLTPYQATVPAVTLLADISGFTALTEHLSQEGPEGIETLTQILNEAFDIAISPAISSGGDVVKFAGDALLAIWPLSACSTDDSSYANDATVSPDLTLDCRDACPSLQHAAAAALTIQDNFRQFAAHRGVDIGLRIGIGLGVIDWAQVGGVDDRWLYVVTGNWLQQLQDTLKAAAPGQVVLSAHAYAVFGQRTYGHLLAGGEYLLHSAQSSLGDEEPYESVRVSKHRNEPDPPTSVEPLTCLPAFISPTVLARLEVGQKDWLAEFRQVTVVFIHLPDWRGAGAIGHRQDLTVALQTLARKYEGNLAFSIDEKGVSALITFGLPQQTHTNDPERGVRIALAIHQLLGDRGERCAIGVASGRVFCGAIGNQLRREYTTIGGAINLAARLMQAVSRREDAVAILCDRATQAAAQPTVDFHALAPIAVKGRGNTVAVFSPAVSSQFPPAQFLSAQSPPNRSVSMVVGRENEYSILVEALQALASRGQGGAIVVEGEAGIGKSQLLVQLCRLADERDIPVLVGGGDSIERQVPYRAWRSIFSQLLDVQGRPSSQVLLHLQERFHHRQDWVQLLPLLTAVLDFEIPDSPVTQTMQGQVRADNTRVLLLDILRDCLDRPMVLVLDDAQWMDSASWQLTQAVLEQFSQIVLAAATRPPDESPPEGYIALTQFPNTRHLCLGLLSPEDTRQQLCRCLSTEAVSDRLVDAIYTKSQGQPLFSEQLALAMQASGQIECRDRSCDLAASFTLSKSQELPNSIRQAIVSRFDGLDPTHQLVLKTASAIGRRFPTSVLQDIYPVAAEDQLVQRSLQTLSQRRFTALWKKKPHLTYRFIHGITQEVAYSLMTFSQRRELHRSAALWYEQQTAELEPAILAYHWERAEQWDAALHYLGLAGERALRDGANAEAVTFLERAIALERSGTNRLQSLPQTRNSRPTQISPVSLFRRARWHRQLGDAYVGLGNLSASGAALNMAVALLDRRFPRTSLGLAVCSVREVLIQLLHRCGLLGLLSRLGLPSRANGVSFDSDRYRSNPRTRDSFSSDRPLKELSLACTHLGEVYYYSNRKSLATFASLVGLNLAEQAGPSPELARIYANMCFATGVNGAPWLAKVYARLATTTAQATPQLNAIAWVDLVVGAHNSGMGHWADAHQQTLAARDRFEQLRDLHRQGEATSSLASIAHWQGDYPTAIAHWQHTRQLGERLGDVQEQLWGLLGEAEEYLVGAQWEPAVTLIEQANHLGARRQGLACEQFRYQALLAQIRLRQGQRTEASRLALSALEQVAGMAAVVLYLMEGYASATAVLLALWAETPEDRCLMANARFACHAHSRYASTFAIARPRALLHWGIWHRIARHPNRAKSQLNRSLRAARQLQLPYEIACAHWQLASTLLSGRSAPRDVHATAARDRFQTLGIDTPQQLLLHQQFSV